MYFWCLEKFSFMHSYLVACLFLISLKREFIYPTNFDCGRVYCYAGCLLITPFIGVLVRKILVFIIPLETFGVSHLCLTQ